MNDEKCSTKFCRNEIEIKYLGAWLCQECWLKKWESYSGVIVEEIKEKKQVDTKQSRYEKVLMKLTHYSAKLKRIENLIKKYESKKKYYDKILINNK
jgi:hypothetical protein